MGVALPDLAAGHRRDGVGQAGNRGPMAATEVCQARNEFQLAPPHNVRCNSRLGGFNVCHPAVARPSRLMPRS